MVLAISTPTVPAPDQDKSQETVNFLVLGTFQRIGGRSYRFCPLESKQDSASNDVGIIERFKARCGCTPFVVPKIVIADASRQDEEVICQVSVLQMNNALLRLDARDLIEQDINIFLTTEN